MNSCRRAHVEPEYSLRQFAHVHAAFERAVHKRASRSIAGCDRRPRAIDTPRRTWHEVSGAKTRLRHRTPLSHGHCSFSSVWDPGDGSEVLVGVGRPCVGASGSRTGRAAVHSRRDKELEFVVLRHELGVLRRQVSRFPVLPRSSPGPRAGDRRAETAMATRRLINAVTETDHRGSVFTQARHEGDWERIALASITMLTTLSSSNSRPVACRYSRNLMASEVLRPNRRRDRA